MSQHDFNVANAFFPALRLDVNNALVAAVTKSSGDSQPGVSFQFQSWMDTSPSGSEAFWKMRDEANAAWFTIGHLNGTVWTPYYQGAPLGNVSVKTIGSAAGQVPTADLTVLKTGGVMTGALTLSGAPTDALHAATKGYADGIVGVPTGIIAGFGGAAAPTGWLLCNGQQVNRVTEAALFSVIGTNYGSGDGVNTFNLPDYRDRTMIGVSATKTLGSTGGAASVTLTVSNLPAHTHTGTTASAGLHNHTGTTGDQSNDHSHNYNNSTTHPTGFAGGPNTHDSTNSSAATTGVSTGHTHNFTTSTQAAHTHTFTTDATGSGTSFSILPPYQAANFVIKK